MWFTPQKRLSNQRGDVCASQPFKFPKRALSPELKSDGNE